MKIIWFSFFILSITVFIFQAPDRAEDSYSQQLEILLKDLREPSKGPGTITKIIGLGKSVIPPLCEILKKETDEEYAFRICNILGQFKDENANLCVLHYMERELTRLEAYDLNNNNLKSPPYEIFSGLKQQVFPALISIGDARIIPLAARLHKWYAKNYPVFSRHTEFVEELLAGLKIPEGIPLLMDSLTGAASGRRRDAAAKALVEINKPVAHYLLEDFNAIPAEEQHLRLRWLVYFADERYVNNILSRLEDIYPGLDLKKDGKTLFLSENDIGKIVTYAGSKDRYIRYHTAEILKSYSTCHSNDMVQKTLAVLSEDKDASIRLAVSGGAARPRPADKFGRKFFPGNEPEKFEINIPPLTDSGLTLNMQIEHGHYSLTEPAYSCNKPIWAKLALSSSDPETKPDLRNGTCLVVRDALGNEQVSHLYRFADLMDHYYPYDYLHWPAGSGPGMYAPDCDNSAGYINLVECFSFNPGDYQLEARLNNEPTEPVSFTINSVYPPKESLNTKVNRGEFNPFTENPYAKILWRKFVGYQSEHRSAITIANSVIIFSRGPLLSAFDEKTGRRLWSFKQDFPFLHVQNTNGTEITAIAVEPAKKESVEYVLDKSTGAVKSQSIKKVLSSAIPEITAVSDDGIYVFKLAGPKNKGVSCLSTITNKIMWTIPEIRNKNGFDTYIDGLFFNDGILYVVTPYSGITAINSTTGEIIWEHDGGSCQGESPAFDGLVMFCSSWLGKLDVLETETGRLLWRMPVYESAHVWRPSAKNGAVFIVKEDGYLYAIKNLVDVSPEEKNK